MAKVIDSQVESQIIASYQPLWQVAILGAGLGLFYWVIAWLASHYTGSKNIPGDIATILTAVAGIGTMIRLRLFQPLIVAVSSAATLWGLSTWLTGLAWWEAVLWVVLLYTLAYLLFSWLSHIRKTWIMVAVAAVIVTILRILTILW